MINSIYDKEYGMYKKNKVNLKNIKRIMSGKERVRISDRRSYSENLMDITTKKLNQRQKEIDRVSRIKKKQQKNNTKNILY
jgi:hypothetical protein|tara:strand:- start:4302 stop:4544 length:243 start_codon:yes stop_codon:yes gene_type:complete